MNNVRQTFIAPVLVKDIISLNRGNWLVAVTTGLLMVLLFFVV